MNWALSKVSLPISNGNAIAYATIVIDGDFVAATTADDGTYEFKLPEGSYTIGVVQQKKEIERERKGIEGCEGTGKRS